MAENSNSNSNSKKAVKPYNTGKVVKLHNSWTGIKSHNAKKSEEKIGELEVEFNPLTRTFKFRATDKVALKVVDAVVEVPRNAAKTVIEGAKIAAKTAIEGPKNAAKTVIDMIPFVGKK